MDLRRESNKIANLHIDDFGVNDPCRDILGKNLIYGKRIEEIEKNGDRFPIQLTNSNRDRANQASAEGTATNQEIGNDYENNYRNLHGINSPNPLNEKPPISLNFNSIINPNSSISNYIPNSSPSLTFAVEINSGYNEQFQGPRMTELKIGSSKKSHSNPIGDITPPQDIHHRSH